MSHGEVAEVVIILVSSRKLALLYEDNCRINAYEEPDIGLECSPMTRETEDQSQVESYQRRKKRYLMPPCLTLSIIRCGSMVKWSNLGKGVSPSPTPWCRSYRKGILRVTLNYGRQLYFYLLTYKERQGACYVFFEEISGSHYFLGNPCSRNVFLILFVLFYGLILIEDHRIDTVKRD